MINYFVIAASEGGSPVDAQWMPLVTTIVVFLIFMLVARVLVWPQITKALDARDEKIRSEIEGAESAQLEATKAKEQYLEEVEKAKREATQMVAAARAEANRVGEDLRTKNQEELGQMRDRAYQDIEQAKTAALEELRAETAKIAVTIATKLLKREVNDSDQTRLLEETLSEIGKR